MSNISGAFLAGTPQGVRTVRANKRKPLSESGIRICLTQSKELLGLNTSRAVAKIRDPRKVNPKNNGGGDCGD